MLSTFFIQPCPSWQSWKLKEFSAFCAPANQKEHSILDTPLLKKYLSFLFLSIYLSMQFLDMKFQNRSQYSNVGEMLGQIRGGGESEGVVGKERRPPPQLLASYS